MTYSEIQAAIELHQKAFAFLLEARASGHAASRPFDESTVSAWQSLPSCVEWVTRHRQELPAACRPEPHEVDAFAHFLTSLFAVSFSVRCVPGGRSARLQVRALPTRRLDDSRKSKRIVGKERRVADELRQFALSALAKESDAGMSRDAIAATMQNAALADDVTLWTYATQLIHRSQFASQGPAIYQLWRDLPEKVRRNLSAELVWQTRGRLIQSFHSPTYEYR